MTYLTRILSALALILIPTLAAALDDFYDHHIALQVSDNHKGTFTKVLNNATNLTKAFESAGETVEIRIVVWNAGLHLLREDTSPELERVTGFATSMPNVTFAACGNTIKGMTKKEGKAPPIVENAEIVPGGIVEAIRLSEDGWTLIRP